MTGQGKRGDPDRVAQAGEPAPLPALVFDVRPASPSGDCLTPSCRQPASVHLSVLLEADRLTWPFCDGCWNALYRAFSGRPHRVVFDG